MKKNYCCKEFEYEMNHCVAPIMGGFAYPTQTPKNQFVQRDDKTWSIYGCCGDSHCFVVTGMKYCPFCGAQINL